MGGWLGGHAAAARASERKAMDARAGEREGEGERGSESKQASERGRGVGQLTWARGVSRSRGSSWASRSLKSSFTEMMERLVWQRGGVCV